MTKGSIRQTGTRWHKLSFAPTFNTPPPRVAAAAFAALIANFVTVPACQADTAKIIPAANQTPTRVTPVQYTQEDLYALAATMVGEAWSEGPEGMMLVAEVIMNRHKISKSGTSVRDVAFQPLQFSCHNKGMKHQLILLKLAHGEPSGSPYFDAAFQRALPIAKRVLEGERTGLLPDDTRHYYAHDLIQPPYWVKFGHKTLVYRGHTFVGGVR